MTARHAWLVAKKDLRGIANERTIVLAIVLQLFIALFSSFLVVGLTSMYDPGAFDRFGTVRYPVAYTGNESPLHDAIRNTRGIQVFPMELPVAVQALRERKLSAVIYDPGLVPGDTGPVTVTLYTIKNDIQAAVVGARLKEAFGLYEQQLRNGRTARLTELPVPIALPRTGTDFYEFVFGLLIPLLIFMPAVVSSALVVDMITEEHQQKTLETLLSTPVTARSMVWGKVLACTILVPVQGAAWILLLWINRIQIGNPAAILLLATLVALVLILIGTLTALVFRERTIAQFVHSTVVVVILLAALALPGNPLNLIALLSSDASAGIPLIAVVPVCIAVPVLGALTDVAVRKTGTG
ncbi:MAG: ABC transporter permease [Methanoregulaceae archaeon]|nr:ABC transporter permease [Methanoregulaceae archaeon]